MPQDEPEVQVTVTGGESAAPPPQIVTVESQPSAPVLEMAREAGAQSAELRQLHETVSTLRSEVEALKSRPVETVIVQPEPEPEPEPEVIPVEVSPSSENQGAPLDQPKTNPGLIRKLFLGM